MDLERKASPEEVDALLRPIFEKLLAQHGKAEAIRLFKRSVVAAGFDPRDFRVIFDEDVS